MQLQTKVSRDQRVKQHVWADTDCWQDLSTVTLDLASAPALKAYILNV